MAEKVVCSECGLEATDLGSIELTKKWIAEGCTPCPNLGCQGQLKIEEIPPIECTNCGQELTSVWAARSVELEKDGGKWIEKNVFSSAVSCPNCHEVLSDEEVSELGIEGY